MFSNSLLEILLVNSNILHDDEQQQQQQNKKLSQNFDVEMEI